jgi:hypothetical protein
MDQRGCDVVVGGSGFADSRQRLKQAQRALYRYYSLFSQHSVKPSVACRLADDSAPAIDWLVSHGLEFLGTLGCASEEPVPRSDVTRRGGRGIVKASAAAATRDANVDVALGSRVDRLLTVGGRVDGVAVPDDGVSAGAGIQ